MNTGPLVPSACVVAQLGARMHYAIPRALARAGLLERLYTDLYAGAGARKLFSALPTPSALAPWSARHARDIPESSVHSFPAFGLRYAARLRLARNDAERSAAFLWAGRAFCRLVNRRGFGSAAAVYAFNDAALEILLSARKAGLRTVLEQTIAPLAVETALLRAEREKFPAWEEAGPADAVLEERCARQREEWEAAEVILCASQFVVDGIRRLGGPWSRCLLVPYGVEGIAEPRLRTAPHTPLRVLTVGAVGLRKGSPYVLRAARALGAAAQFRMAGPAQLSPAARAEFEGHVELLGPVPRNQVRRHFEWADVFLLPSVCEGSATATYEALAAGLPVVCTHNTGSVVTDGADGFLVPARDHLPIVERMARFAEPGVLEAMSANALAKARAFDLEAYSRRALAAIAPAALAVCETAG